MNSVSLIGRITKDLELKITNSGDKMLRFTLAVKRDKQTSDFINCVAWNGAAEILNKFVSKGGQVGINGRIQTRNYESNGDKHYVTEVLVTNIVLLGSKKDTAEPCEHLTPSDGEQLDMCEDDLPFY